VPVVEIVETVLVLVLLRVVRVEVIVSLVVDVADVVVGGPDKLESFVPASLTAASTTSLSDFSV